MPTIDKTFFALHQVCFACLSLIIPSSGNSFPFQSDYPFVVYVFCLACLFVYPLFFFFFVLLGRLSESKKREMCTNSLKDRQRAAWRCLHSRLNILLLMCARFALCVFFWFSSFACAFTHFAVGSLVMLHVDFFLSVNCCATVLLSFSHDLFFCLFISTSFHFLYTRSIGAVFFGSTSHFFRHCKVQKRGTAQSYRVKEVTHLTACLFGFLFLFLRWVAYLFA